MIANTVAYKRKDSCCVNTQGSIDHKLIRVNNVVQYDPTRTLTLRNRFVREMEKRFNKIISKIRVLIVDENFLAPNESILFGNDITTNLEFVKTNQEFVYRNSAAKVGAFNRWLQDQIDAEILETFTSPGAVFTPQPWTNQYIRSAYQKGISRASADVKKVVGATGDVPGAALSAGAFNQPIHIDRVALLYTRTFNDLKSVASDMEGQLSRILSQSMADGHSPRRIASLIRDSIKGRSIVRARMVARSEIIRAHHQANVNEYELAGIDKVVVKAEWTTAGFNVCPICQQNEGFIFTLQEIRGLIPAHPNCRCVISPHVEDVKSGRKRTRKTRSGKVTTIERPDKTVKPVKVKKIPIDDAVTWKKVRDIESAKNQFNDKLKIRDVEFQGRWTEKAKINAVNLYGEDILRVKRKHKKLSGIVRDYDQLKSLVFHGSASSIKKVARSSRGLNGFWTWPRHIKSRITGERVKVDSTIHILHSAKDSKKYVSIKDFVKGKWTVGKDPNVFQGRDPTSTFRHEFAHHIELNEAGEGIKRRWTNEVVANRDWQRVAQDGTHAVSKYGSTDSAELFSESFAAYTTENYGITGNRLPKPIEDFMKSILD